MELRVLRYFLTVAREQSITGAAKALNVTQPTLSKQLMELEEELGKKLLIRGNRKITLTEAGMLLRGRAQEIVDLADRTEADFHEEPELEANLVVVWKKYQVFCKAAENFLERLQEEISSAQ